MSSALQTPAITQPTKAEAMGVGVEKLHDGFFATFRLYWKYDMRAGLSISPMSLVYALGVAMASGLPPVCGVVAGIVAGIVLPIMRGSNLAIASAATGLAPAIWISTFTLGLGVLGQGATQAEALEAGYPLVLVAIFFAGIGQVIMAWFRLARFATIFPTAAIEGMIASIGLLVSARQLQLVLGTPIEAHEFWGTCFEGATHLLTGNFNPNILALSAGCLAAMFLLAALPWKPFKMVPPLVWVFVGGTAFAQLFMDIAPEHLVSVPSKGIMEMITFPDFATVFANFWKLGATILGCMLLIKFVDGTESLSSTQAVDKMDRFKRRHSPNLTLAAMGVCNMISSLLGGPTVIPNVVNSKPSIEAGARSTWANLYNAIGIVILFFFLRDLINMVPKAVLAAILCWIGWSMCKPSKWVDMWDVGFSQIVVFTITVLVTVSTDLLIGVLVGTATEILILALYDDLNYHLTKNGDNGSSFRQRFVDLFRDPVKCVEIVDGVYKLHCNRNLVCANLTHLVEHLDKVPVEGISRVVLVLHKGVRAVDHSTFEMLEVYHGIFGNRDEKVGFEIDGIDRMITISGCNQGLRMAAAYPPSEVP